LLVGAGALFALVVVAAVGLLLFTNQTVQVTGTPGEVVHHVLPDGSSVELAGGSLLSYRRGLRGESRVVALEGDAYFDVVSRNRSFIVRTANAFVEVLGTRFGVGTRKINGEPRTTAVVESGRV